MKTLTVFTVILVVILTACAPIIPASGGTEATPVQMTAEVSVSTAEVRTVTASTVGAPGTEVPFPTPEPPTAIPPLPSATLSPTELKYKVLDQFPDFFFCDPDFYPVARDDAMSLAVGTLIDTPHGAVRVEKLQVGDQVWTMNAAGERVVAVILQTGSVRVPATHQVVHVILSDGRELWASPGHPTADGGRLADLKVGDMLDGAHAVLVERVPYHGSSTYDLLPSGGTGFYCANGILMGSTLK